VSDPVRVLIADHDAASRAGVRLSLVAHDFDVCGEAASADAAAEAARRERPDVCLVEAGLPGGGVTATGRVLAEAPQTVVVMLSGSPDDEELLAAVRAGARGYLLKDMDPARLPMALRGALDGEAALPRSLMGRVLEELRALEHGRHASELAQLGVDLTRREQEVLELLDRGLETAEISQVLGISAVTVRRHVSHVLRKLRAPDRGAALRRLRESGASAFRD
jgi:DNA-binding NarL/FixJ family response regulator